MRRSYIVVSLLCEGDTSWFLCYAKVIHHGFFVMWSSYIVVSLLCEGHTSWFLCYAKVIHRGFFVMRRSYIVVSLLCEGHTSWFLCYAKVIHCGFFVMQRSYIVMDDTFSWSICWECISGSCNIIQWQHSDKTNIEYSQITIILSKYLFPAIDVITRVFRKRLRNASLQKKYC